MVSIDIFRYYKLLPITTNSDDLMSEALLLKMHSFAMMTSSSHPPPPLCPLLPSMRSQRHFDLKFLNSLQSWPYSAYRFHHLSPVLETFSFQESQDLSPLPYPGLIASYISRRFDGAGQFFVFHRCIP